MDRFLDAKFLLFGLILGYFAFPIANSQQNICLDGSVNAIISPGAADQMLHAINSAKSSLHIILYEFSYPDLKEALINAKRRGVDVKIILEPKVDQNLKTATFLKGKGIEVRWANPKFNNSHAKTAIIDGKTVIVGSLNWSRNAMERNREIGVLLESQKIADELEGVFESDWDLGLEVN
ncbi:MAG: phospholipase D-like domain-containing protein [Candidatus Micrarchaeota archaeon]